MTKKPDFDLELAHKYFSAECFNRAWDYIDQDTRTSQEADMMLHLSLASLWHWTQRKDCTPTNLSVGYWQASRVFALLNQADNARHYGELCLEEAQKAGVSSFYLGYAYEALARAESLTDNIEKKGAYLIQARQVATTLSDSEERKQLLHDLDTIN